MLDSIRSSAQSFGVKLAFGVIILVFVFWGIGNFNDRDYSNVVAMVNGEPIVAQEFEKAYQNAEEFILRNNPGVTREQLIQQHLGRQVLNELIRATLLQQEARRAGIEITPLEMRQAVGKIPSFQDDQGKFDPEAYKRMLAARRISAAQYEKELSDQLLQDKLFALVAAPVWVPQSEALNRYNFLREQREVSYLFVPDSRFMADVKISDKDIRDWYENHKDNFAIPARVDVSYIQVDPVVLGNPAEIPLDALKTWYEANKANFEIPEQVKVAHILAQVAEDADEQAQKEAKEAIESARADLDAGKPFAEVADAVNGERAAGPGGELGWISRGQTVAPFEEAAFGAVPGKVTGPVRSPFGWHLILVEEKKEAGVKTFEEVEEEGRKALALEAGQDKIQDVLDNLIEDNILLKPLDQSAAKYNLNVAKTGLVDQNELAQKINVKPAAVQTLMAAPAGAPLDTALEAGDNYIVARVEASEPASIKPLEEVQAEIENILKSQKAQEAALKDAAALLDKYKANDVKDIADLTTATVRRGGALADYNADTALNAAIFETKPGQWLPRPYAAQTGTDRGAVIVRVDKALAPESAEFEQAAELLNNAAKQDRMEAVYEMVVQKLADKAKIEVLNQTLIDRGQN